MSTLNKVFSREKLIQLVIGASGIYFCYLVAGIIQERLIKHPYINTISKQQEYFKFPIYFMIFPHGLTYLMSIIYNYFTLSKSERVIIPNKNSSMCAILSLLGGITFNYAILWTNYPIVVTVKSCNLLSVILVGALCSRVTDSKAKISTKKIIIGLIASVGILLFTYFDPEKKTQDQKKFKIIGFVLLFVSLLSDGFLPDFQAEIKTKFKPKPTQMMEQINKWVALFSLIYALVLGQIVPAIKFMIQHEWFLIHLTVLGMLNCCGQFFIYRMIKQFKQHIVPFVITTRKILTVVISILFYNHPTSFGQIFGVILVFSVVIYEFLSEMYQQKKQQKKQEKVIQIIQHPSPKGIQENQQKQLLQSRINILKK